MTDTLSINSSDLIQQRNKGKRLHRRTQSTFDLNFASSSVPEKESNAEEFTQEMIKLHNILDANVTQKILDVVQIDEDDREVIVDDIDEIPITSAIAPKLNSENNPMSLIKRRNLSTMIPGSGTHCPIRKINLFLELQNIDDLTGLDTIYERKNSVESIDMETLDTLPSNQQIGEQSIERITPNIFSDSLKDISKQYSSDAILPPPASSKMTNSKVSDKKPTHSRQSSADHAMPRSRKESFEGCWDKKDGVKMGKPTHSKHASIDWNNKENSRQENFDNKTLKISEHLFQRNGSKPTHAKKLSLNIPRNANGKPSNLSIQNVNSTNLNINNSRPQTSKPTTKANKPEEKSTKSSKKYTENTKYYATLPRKIQEFMPEEDFVDTRNKFIKELNNINLEKRKNSHYNKATTLTSNTKITRHTRNVTSVIGNISSSTKNNDSSKSTQNGQNPRSRHERKRSDSQGGRSSLSTSPFRKVSPNLSSYATSKEASRPESRAAETRKGEQMKKIMRADIETSFEPGVPRKGSVTPKVSRGLENSMQKLIEKTDILEEQVSSILQFVSSFKSEEALLRERVKTQEDQIRTLQETLFKYEEEMTHLKANGVCKTEGDCESRTRLKKDPSEVRIMTTADTASFESPFTEPSSWLLSCKETKTKGKISPFSTTSSGHNNSAKNDSKRGPDGFLHEYKNFIKKGLLAQQPTNKKR